MCGFEPHRVHQVICWNHENRSLGSGCIGGTCHRLYIAPHEAVGYVSGEAGYCKVKMDIGRYSPSALFKTFACSETADSKDCYYLVYDGETCTTSYHYHEDH